MRVLSEAIQRVTEAYGLEPEFHPPRTVAQVPRRLADTRRPRVELGFWAEVSLDEGRRRLIAWRRQFTTRHEAVLV